MDSGAAKDATQDRVHLSMIVRLGRWALDHSGKGFWIVVGAVSLDVAKAPIVAYIQGNLPLLWETAALYGPAFQTWFATVLFQVSELAGAVAAIEAKPQQTKRKD